MSYGSRAGLELLRVRGPCPGPQSCLRGVGALRSLQGRGAMGALLTFGRPQGGRRLAFGPQSLRQGVLVPRTADLKFM